MSTSGLPANWRVAPLKEVASVNPPRAPLEDNGEPFAFVPMRAVQEEMGGIDVSEARPLEAVRSGYTQFKIGDVLFAKITPCMENGKIAIVPALSSPVGFGSTEFHVLRPQDGIVPRWVAYFLRKGEFRRAAQRNMSGSAGQLRVPKRWLEAQEIPVPPIAVQQNLVDKIDELFSDLDAGVAALERARANLARYRAAVLKAAVEGKLTEQWRGEHPDVEPASELLRRILHAREEQAVGTRGRARSRAPAAPIPSRDRQLPPSWTWATVDQVSGEVRYGSSSKASPDHIGVPVLRMGNIVDGALDLSSLKFLRQDHKEFPELLLRDGDVLFNRTNSAELVGKSAVYRGVPQPCSFASYLIRLRLVRGVIPEYLCHVINSHFGRRWIRSVVSQQVGQANVNGTKLKSFTFPLPPLREQEVIVEHADSILTTVVRAVGECDAILARAGILRSGVLAKAFSGELLQL